MARQRSMGSEIQKAIRAFHREFMRNQLQMMESSPAWSMPQSSFEQAVSMRVGYKAAFDAVQKLLVQERLRAKDASRTEPDRPANESSLN